MAAENTTRPRSCSRTKASRPRRIVGRAVRAGDRDQSAAIGETRERRGDVAQGGVGHAAIDVRDRGEWRVHQHDARNDAGVEMIVDLRGVEAGDGDAGEEMVQQPGAGLGQLVQNERAAGEFGEDGEQPGAGRRLQHEIGGRDRGGGAGRQAERRSASRTAEAPGSPRSGGCGWEEGRRSWPASAAWRPEKMALRADGWAELAQEQDGRRLAGIVGGLPVPGAIGVGSAEGGDHRCRGASVHRRAGRVRDGEG